MALAGELKIVILCSPEANQRALANKVAEEFAGVDIILCEPGQRHSERPAMSFGRIARGVVGLPLRKAWLEMLSRYDRSYAQFPKSPRLRVTDVNDPAVAAAIEAIGPDLVIVSGTNLLKQPLIDAISRTAKIMNLHTGISPYVRGGPNCTNWCLSIGRFDLIGNTVMWIDKGIDSGNLVATEQTPFSRQDSLVQLHFKVMEHAHDLLLRCVRGFADGKPLPSIVQKEIDPGRLFLTKQWNAIAAARAVGNFYLRIRRPPGADAGLRLISPDVD